ncbi:MAG: hypothetical protein A3K22_02290 [Deltaproteobacteria bacterium RBG_16_42_7]|nr:MAG: hypothetical protein A3K22_02290 [Deltaproteobacteria bacterium RBG_16_42_7]
MLTLTEQINKRNWWHSPPADKKAYRKRGIFLASSYKECEFYGRPLNKPIKVSVSNPLVDTEENVIRLLFGDDSPQMSAHMALKAGGAREPLKVRFKLDKDLFSAAKGNNYDAIAIVTEKGLEKVRNCRLPKSVELNVLDIENGIFIKRTGYLK